MQILENLKSFIIREKFFLLIFPVAVLFLLTLNPNWNPTWDSATYITLGKSLITGHGYKYMGYSHIKYPPVFPLLLSPIIGVFGYNYLLMRLMIVIMGICSIGMVYLLFRRHKTPSTKIMAVSVMLLSAVSYPLLFEATRILSDIPYMFFSFLALIFIDKYSSAQFNLTAGGPSKNRLYLNKIAYLTIFFILLSYFTRLVGLTLVAAAIPYLFLRAKQESKSMLSSNPWLNTAKKAAFIGVIFLAFASVWVIRNQVLKNRLPKELIEGMSYEQELVLVEPSSPYPQLVSWKNMMSRVKNNLNYYESLMTNIISGQSISSKTGIYITSLILLCGFLFSAISNPTIIEFYTFFYVWIYLFWPSLQGERFLVPIIPFIFYYFLAFVKSIVYLVGYMLKKLPLARGLNSSVNIRGKISIINFSAITIVTCGLFWLNFSPAINIITGEHRKPYYQGDTANYINSILWVKENTPSDSVVVTDRAPWTHLLSGRKAFTFPWVPNTQEVINSIEKNGATHVIAIPWGYSEAYLTPTITAYPDKFTEIHRIESSIIYQVNPR